MNKQNRKCYTKAIAASLVCFTFVLLAFLFGAFSYPRNIWLIELNRKVKISNVVANVANTGQYDSFGRLTSYPNKIKIKCPTQTSDVGVLLVIGQSNSANHAEKKLTTQYPQQVLNYYEGECYVASSPLLGATSEGGELLYTPRR